MRGERSWPKKLRGEVVWWTKGTRPAAVDVAQAIFTRLVRVLARTVEQIDPDASEQVRHVLDV